MYEGELATLVLIGLVGCAWMALLWRILGRLPGPPARLPEPGTPAQRILLLRSRVKGLPEAADLGGLTLAEQLPEAGRLSAEHGDDTSGRLSAA